MSAQNFPPASRYYSVDTASLTDANGRTLVYLKRRFIPQPDQFQLLQLHQVAEGDRLDNIAAQFLGDPEQYWRLCDANNAMVPTELTETPNRTLRITLPEGIVAFQSGQ